MTSWRRIRCLDEGDKDGDGRGEIEMEARALAEDWLFSMVENTRRIYRAMWAAECDNGNMKLKVRE